MPIPVNRISRAAPNALPIGIGPVLPKRKFAAKIGTRNGTIAPSDTPKVNPKETANATRRPFRRCSADGSSWSSHIGQYRYDSDQQPTPGIGDRVIAGIDDDGRLRAKSHALWTFCIQH